MESMANARKFDCVALAAFSTLRLIGSRGGKDLASIDVAVDAEVLATPVGAAIRPSSGSASFLEAAAAIRALFMSSCICR